MKTLLTLMTAAILIAPAPIAPTHEGAEFSDEKLYLVLSGQESVTIYDDDEEAE